MAEIGYALIEHFAVAVERCHRPELRDRPVILGGYPHERKSVYDASNEAIAMGVKAGMALRQAEQICPAAVFLPLVETRYAEAAATFLGIVECFSPTVEPDAFGSAYFDARGLEPLFGAADQLAHRLAAAINRQLGLAIQVGLGPTRFTARVAAHLSLPDSPLVVSSTPAEFLSTLAVAYLPGDPAFGERLRLLGIRTIGQFLKLPAPELMEQFGPAGVVAYELARGHSDAVLLPRPLPAVLQHRQEFEPPLSSTVSLTHAIGRLSGALVITLQRRYQACQTVILRLDFGDGATAIEETAQLNEPAADPTTITTAALRLSERICVGKAMLDHGGTIENNLASPQVTAIQLLVASLVAQSGRQQSFFDQLGPTDAQRRRRYHLQSADAELRRRFGNCLKRAERALAAGVADVPFLLHNYFD